MPAPGTDSTKEASGTVQTVYGRFEVSTKAIAATKNDKGSYIRIVDFKMRTVGENLKKDLNAMLNGDGSGALAKVSSVAGQDITVDNALRIRKNQVLNAFTARSGGTQQNADFTVTNVNYATNVVTVTGTISAVAANSFLFKNTGRGVNVMGLLGIVDDGTFLGTLHNIARSGNDFWKANVLANGGTNRDITLSLLQAAEDRVYTIAGGKVSLWYSNMGQRANYVAILVADKRFVNNMELDGGFKAVEYNGNPWVLDRDCDKNRVYGLDESVIRFFQLEDVNWMEEDGAILARAANTLSYQAVLQGHMELGCYQPNREVVVVDLKEPASY